MALSELDKQIAALSRSIAEQGTTTQEGYHIPAMSEGQLEESRAKLVALRTQRAAEESAEQGYSYASFKEEPKQTGIAEMINRAGREKLKGQ